MEKGKKYFVHVQYCTNCHSHSWCTHHKEAKYHQTYIKLKNLLYQHFKQQKEDIQIISNQVPKHFISIKQQQNKYYNPMAQKYVFFPNIGSFEITINGQIVFSKKKGNIWPSLQQILDIFYLKVRNKKRDNQSFDEKKKDSTSRENQMSHFPSCKKLELKTLYKQKSNFSLTNHFKAYHTIGSSTTIENQFIKPQQLKFQKSYPMQSSRVKINVENIQKLKEALQTKEEKDIEQMVGNQKSKQKEILINLSSIQQQNNQLVPFIQNLKKLQETNKSYHNLTSQKSLSRKKLQQWQFDLNLAQTKFNKIQNKVKYRKDMKFKQLQLQINENINQQLQTNINSSLRKEINQKEYNKKNVQSFYHEPNVIFQNLQGSRFKKVRLEQDQINWRSTQNIIQSKKIKQIEKYIQANQQYKNQKLRKIYGNWKFQGSVSQHINHRNVQNSKCKKHDNVFKIKKSQNIFNQTQQKNFQNHCSQLAQKNKKIQDQDQNDCQSSSSTVCLRQKINNTKMQENKQKKNSKNVQLNKKQSSNNKTKIQDQKFKLYEQNQLRNVKNSKQKRQTFIKQKKVKISNVQQKIQNKVQKNIYLNNQKLRNFYNQPFKQIKSFHIHHANKQVQNVSLEKQASKNIFSIKKSNCLQKKLERPSAQNFIKKKLSVLKQNSVQIHLKHSQKSKISKKRKEKKQENISKQLALSQKEISLDDCKQQFKKKFDQIDKQEIKDEKIDQQVLDDNSCKKEQQINTQNAQQKAKHLNDSNRTKRIYLNYSNQTISGNNYDETSNLNNQDKKKIERAQKFSLCQKQINIVFDSMSINENFPQKQEIQLMQKCVNSKQTNQNQKQQQQTIVQTYECHKQQQKEKQHSKKDQKDQQMSQKEKQKQFHIETNYNQSEKDSQKDFQQFTNENFIQHHQVNQKHEEKIKENQFLKKNQFISESNQVINQHKTHKKSKFSQLFKFQKQIQKSQLKQNFQNYQNNQATINCQTKFQQQDKVKQNLLKLKELKENKLNFSYSCHNSLQKEKEKFPCKCTLRQQQSHRRKCQSYQKNMIKYKQRQKKYTQTKKRRQFLQQQRQKYLLQKLELKKNKDHKKNQSLSLSRKKFHTINIFSQKSQKKYDHCKIYNNNNSIRRGKNKKEKANKLHSKTVKYDIAKNNVFNQSYQCVEQYNKSQDWRTFQQQSDSYKQLLLNSKKRNFCKKINKKNVNSKKQKKIKRHHQTIGIQTLNFNQVSIQTQFQEKQLNIKQNQKFYSKFNINNEQKTNLSKKGQGSIFSQNNDKINSFMNIKVKDNQILEQQRQEIIQTKDVAQKQKKIRNDTQKQIQMRSDAQIKKQIFGQSVQIEKQKYQTFIKQKATLKKKHLEIQQVLKYDFQINQSLQQIYGLDLMLFNNRLNFMDFQSNSQKNVNFMKTVLMLAKRNQLLIIRLFQNYKPNIELKSKSNTQFNCYYGVWICVNRQWRIIIVNDVIPVRWSVQDNKYQPVFCQKLEFSIWPIILQKALALGYGGYKNYLKMSCGQIFQALTGSNYNEFKISQDLNKNKQFLKYINQNQKRNYIIYCQKRCQNTQNEQNVPKQIKAFTIINKKIINQQQILFKIMEISSQIQQNLQFQPYYIKYQKFCETFKNCEILHLRQHHNYFQLQLNQKGNDEQNKKIFFVVQLTFQQQSFGCITVSNEYQGNLRTYLYKQQNEDIQLLKLVGEATKTNKKCLFFDCHFQACRYFLFVQSQHKKSILSYLGQGKPSILFKEFILQSGFKNNISQYLPVFDNQNNKNSQKLKIEQFRKFSNTNHSPKNQNININKEFQSLRQKFIDLLLYGKNSNNVLEA